MTKSILTKKILYWYDNNKRSLPWRKELSQVKREYYTLVSEFMLQQTQVATVIPYFNNFIKDIPDIKSLSKIKEHKPSPFGLKVRCAAVTPQPQIRVGRICLHLWTINILVLL